jgi:hypothetical protein
MKPVQSPKYTHYMSDGKGRDSYIMKGNGGLCFEGQRTKEFSTLLPNNAQYSNPAP